MTYRNGTTGFNQGMCRPQQQRNRHTFPYSCTPKRTGTKFIFQEPSQRKPLCLYSAGLSSTTTLHHKHHNKQGKHSLPSVSPIISRMAWGVVRLIQDCSPLAWLVQIRESLHHSTCFPWPCPVFLPWKVALLVSSTSPLFPCSCWGSPAKIEMFGKAFSHRKEFLMWNGAI